MAWYWWVLIAVGVVVIGYIKIVVGKKMLASMKEKKERERRLAEED
ncbi:MAG: hypothetical protein Q8K99_11140 [Actinomycetota bacterium]|nr:hypothetical protein [Actinomycetota bacterium]